VTFVVVAVVPYIPTVNSSTVRGPAGESIPSGGALVDYPTYNHVYEQNALAAGAGEGVPLDTVWLRTTDDPTQLTAIRAALTNGDVQLQNLQDRRANEAGLARDPLVVNLLGVLGIGAAVALLLALLGNLLTSWFSARSRLTSFAILRALGTGPGQVAGVLSWEQGIIYAVALLLGIGFGTLLSLLVVPALVFTGTSSGGSADDPSTGAFYASQGVPPIQVVFSPWLWLALALLAGICGVALWMMVRVVSRPSLGQTLRLNED
jgi:hypothetical protein